MKKKQFFGLGVGLSSVVMIFVVLCLTAFAVLAYFCAKADSKLTDKKAAYAINYQKADSKAKEQLSKIDTLLLDAAEKTLTIKETEKKLDKEGYKIAYDEYKKPYISYVIELENKINLLVDVAVLTDGDKVNISSRYRINRWQVVNSGFEIEEENLNLYK